MIHKKDSLIAFRIKKGEKQQLEQIASENGFSVGTLARFVLLRLIK